MRNCNICKEPYQGLAQDCACTVVPGLFDESKSTLTPDARFWRKMAIVNVLVAVAVWTLIWIRS